MRLHHCLARQTSRTRAGKNRARRLLCVGVVEAEEDVRDRDGVVKPRPEERECVDGDTSATGALGRGLLNWLIRAKHVPRVRILESIGERGEGLAEEARRPARVLACRGTAPSGLPATLPSRSPGAGEAGVGATNQAATLRAPRMHAALNVGVMLNLCDRVLHTGNHCRLAGTHVSQMMMTVTRQVLLGA